jgi:hypothetical protein
MKKILLFLMPVLFVFSCRKTDRIDETSTTDKSTPMYQYIKQLGYRDSEIVDNGTEYLVDGDLLFSKTAQPDMGFFNGPREEQYGTSNYVGYTVQPNITVRIDPSMNAYAAEINGAIALWNNLANFRVRFTLTTATNQSILITNASLGAGVCGAAYFPLNGTPGGLVRINIAQIAGNPFAQRQRTIAHELGHCIGFRHTNWQPNGEGQAGQDPNNGAYFNAVHIMGTPTGGDANSLMNGGQCGSGATVLSNFDILAAQMLYPANPPFAGTVPVFRYYSQNTSQDHFYTTNYNELQNGSNTNYIFEGIGFFAFPNQVASSVPVYRYFRGASGDHHYTSNFGELGGGAGGYVYEGIGFYAYPSAINGAVPVHRYWAPGPSDHFFTKNQNEFLFGTFGYVYEGIGWFAF